MADQAIPVPPAHNYAGGYGNNNYGNGYYNQYQGYDDRGGYQEHDKGDKKNKDNKDKDKDKPVEPDYVGFIIKPLPSRLGEKESWAKVGKTDLPFDNEKLYRVAQKHRKEGKEPALMFKDLLANQQGMIDRLREMQQQMEKNKNAIWVLYDIQKIKKDIPRSMFVTERKVVSLQVIYQRQDKRKSAVSDKQSNKAGNGSTFKGEIIDLSVPLKKKDNKSDNKNKSDNQSEDDWTDLLKGLDLSGDNGHYDNYRNPGYHQGYGQDQGGYEQQQYQNYAYDQHNGGQHDQQAQHGQYYNNNGYQQHAYNQTPYPEAPNPPHNNYHHNPFMPEVGHPEQYETPPTLDVNDRAHMDYSPRRMSRSRSRHRRHSRHRSDSCHRRHSRHRSSSRPRHHHRRRDYTPSDDSYEHVEYWSPVNGSEFTPPSTPDLDDEELYRSLGRRGSGKYIYERRTKYPNERGVYMQPATSGTRYDFKRIGSKRRPAMIHANSPADDYPDARRQNRLTNYAEADIYADYRPRASRNERRYSYTPF